MFARLFRGPVNWFTGSLSETNHEDDDSDKTDNTLDATDASGSYEPTVLDVIVVKAMLNKATRLPPEIVDTVVDLAEYWPHTSTEIIYTDRPANDRKDANSAVENQFLLRTPPLGFVRSPYSSPEDIERPPPPQPLEQEFESEDFQDLIASRVSTLARPCRKIVFTTLSHDQGWGGVGERGTYSNSWTWFEAGLERCNKKTNQGGGDSHTTFSLPVKSDQSIPISQSIPTSRLLPYKFKESGGDLQDSLERLALQGKNEREIKESGSPDSSPESEDFKIISTGQIDSSTSTAPPRPSFDLSSLATLKPAVTTLFPQDSGTHSFDHDLLPPDDCTIQRNVVSDRTMKEHCIVWSYTDDIIYPTSDESGEPIDKRVVSELEDCGRGKATGDGEFVRNLKLGDIVTVWAKARFPGWANHVDRVKVDVYWAV